ncbi:MAG: SulP family inorganic anion transporter [Hyphomicrobiales bacterium]|nr:SulP family inorganic anion transporter [Hyphomicrobiales bacterium]
MSNDNKQPNSFRRIIRQIAPGLEALSRYERPWLPHDLGAGLSVAAIALPIGIAYAELAGVPIVVGMYSAIFPLLAYALFGSSRQLMVGPDAATCIMVAASLGHLSNGDPERYLALMVILTLMTGVLYVIAGIARLGFIANFLSQPILVGFLNGIAALIIVGQLHKLLGFSSEASGFFPKFMEIFSKVDFIHGPTLRLGFALFILLLLLRWLAPKLPAALIVVIAGIVAVVYFGLEEQGVAVLGEVPAGLPAFHFTTFDLSTYAGLLGDAAAVMIISFTSGVLTAKSFARRNRYEIDANQEMIGFGVANIVTGLAQGFPITGADSRTAVNDATGGKSQLVGIIAAGTMLLVLFFLTKPLGNVPNAGLAVVIMVSAYGLFDFTALQDLRIVSWRELVAAQITTLGILILGPLPGVILAISLTFMWLLYIGSRPNDAILGRTTGSGVKGFHSIVDYPDAKTYKGLIIYRFEADLLFYNIDYFKQRLLKAIDESQTPVEWVVIDASPINIIDMTAVQKIDELHDDLEKRGIVLARARARQSRARFLSRNWAQHRAKRQREIDFPTLNAALSAFHKRPKRPS